MKKLCQEHHFNVNHQVVEGGNTRFESVSNALKKVNEKSVVAVHDGVRPLVKNSVVNECMQIAQENGTAIPVIAIEESLRQKRKVEVLLLIETSSLLFKHLNVLVVRFC